MASMGLIEIVLILLTGGGGANDIVSLYPIQSYFKSHQLEIDVEKAIKLAGRDPVDGKTQIAQLLALRYLADESGKLKNDANYDRHRELLTQIAAGKTAQDPQGFAKDYAARVLARLDGTKSVAVALPSVRDEPFRWFPAAATFLAAVDSRSLGTAGAAPNLDGIFKMIPPEALKTVFGVVDKIGNVRVDRAAFAFVEHPQQQELGQIYLRLTGKANTGWLLEAIKDLNQPVKTIKGPQGESIATLVKPNGAPGVMFIGDHDFVVAGLMGNKGEHEEMLSKVLDIRDGKAKHAAEGLLRAELAKIPAKAVGLVVGNVPQHAFRGAPFPSPVTISGHVLPAQKARELHLTAGMANDDDAKQLVMVIGQFHKKAIESLKAPLNAGAVDPIARQRAALIELLDSMQFEANGNQAQIRMLLPEGTIGAASLLLGMRAGPGN